ncbi:MAG: class I SAM-dependent methyltransferase [Acidobacteria bacterium]|nr:class I SAM-dependent methyltransferase [Acidobacteriota bacterium]
MPTPERFFSAVNGFVQTSAMRGAIELDIFTAVGEGNTTVQTIASRCQASERGIRVLCDYLTIHGFLTKENGNYGLAPDAAFFLDRRSPAYLGGITGFLLQPEMVNAFKDLATTVRQGKTILKDEGTVSEENPIWVDFARAMAPMMMMPAQMIAEIVQVPQDRPIKVLDIAAGHGVFGITLAQKNPNVEVTAVDWAPVLSVALENAKKFGVDGRYSTIEGSAFDVKFGTGYDLVLLTNFLHHFDVATCESLLKKVYSSLNDGGRALTLEFVPNEDRVSPPGAASFAMTMLATTGAGDAYTFSEYDRMFLNAGFSSNEIHPLAPSPQSLIISMI